jgi:hypothetical protein
MRTIKTYIKKGRPFIMRHPGGIPQCRAKPAAKPGDLRRLIPLLFQLGVFGPGLLQDRDVRVGVFPEGEEIIVGCFGFGCVALK